MTRARRELVLETGPICEQQGWCSRFVPLLRTDLLRSSLLFSRRSQTDILHPKCFLARSTHSMHAAMEKLVFPCLERQAFVKVAGMFLREGVPLDHAWTRFVENSQRTHVNITFRSSRSDISAEDMNAPKWVSQDVPLYNALLSDIFPGRGCGRVGEPCSKQPATA